MQLGGTWWLAKHYLDTVHNHGKDVRSLGQCQAPADAAPLTCAADVVKHLFTSLQALATYLLQTVDRRTNDDVRIVAMLEPICQAESAQARAKRWGSGARHV